MGANASSIPADSDIVDPNPPLKLKLGAIPESCVALILSGLDHPEICKLSRLNRAFRDASSADFIWENKLPSNYRYLLDKLGDREVGGVVSLGKKEIYTRFSKPISFDSGTKETWVDKRSGGVFLSISSKALTITGIDDRRYWTHISTDESRGISLWSCPAIALTSIISTKVYVDFVQSLQTDMAIKILMTLDDPADLICASSVSRFWQQLVIGNGLCKKLCEKMYPQLGCIARVIDDPSPEVELVDNGPSDNETEWQTHQREHRAYASLFCAIRRFPFSYCIANPVSASSTDNYPVESIMNTLDPRDLILHTPSYWSSTGSDDPEKLENLIYNLSDDFCVITEINIQPFQALFQLGHPIYSSKYVRFRMGHLRDQRDFDHDFMEAQENAEDKFTWTYVSEKFPMVQENRLQKFELTEPALCVGGFLQIELLGRVQTQRLDGKFYVCVAHVQAIGRPLSPAFNLESSGAPINAVTLKYSHQEFCHISQSASNGALSTSLLPILPPHQIAWGNLQDFMDMLNANDEGILYQWIGDDDEEEDMDPMLMF